ncbi:MAG: 3-methyl-2-oxobutanoate hydroxymethyltransferase, partial [Promethearchaeota archaeon]
LTAYDYTTAKALDFAGIDSILVGDSMGMVIYGEDSTLKVTMDDLVRHTQAVAKGTEHAMVIADMPFMSFALPEDALRNAGRLVKEGSADAVKLEGGRERIEAIKLILNCGIPVMGHLGLTPQYIHRLGGYKLQGKTAKAAERLLEDALLLEKAGVFSIVLEMVPQQIAKVISEQLSIPTIGIGAGIGCDGQVLVVQDMMGASSGKSFKFVKKYADLWNTRVSAVKEYIQDVRKSAFPTESHSFNLDDEEWKQFQEYLSQKKT